ncbi:MAG TPA: DUF1566 domain-containing protein [bacterium]|nr:DUF1566 domain-containing protein [bacterium]HPQ65988.1 DUF1566 domain-containing protein [bacterium]
MNADPAKRRRKRFVGALAGMAAIAAAGTGRAAAQDPYGLPRTGQAASYHYAAPYDLGDDGYLRIGYPREGVRFVDNGDGTVSDLGTGLIWQKDDSGYRPVDGLEGMVSWDDAFAYVSGLNSREFGSRTDWRLPNIKELLSIVNEGTWLPAAYSIFSWMHESPYWSSTHHPFASTGYAPYYINMGEGHANAGSTETAYVKAVASLPYSESVRGFPKTGQVDSIRTGDDGDLEKGYPLTAPAYLDYAEYVEQAATGLCWQKTDSRTRAFGSLEGELTWEEAFDYVRAMNESGYAGFGDWRLPNYFELYSLLEFRDRYPEALIDESFDPAVPALYWTGTSRYGVPDEAFGVRFLDGWSGQVRYSDRCLVRGVRGGPYRSPTPAPSCPTPTPDPGTLTGLPRSGQLDSYHPAGPYDFGDDGAVRAGYPLQGERFGTAGSTVADLAAGLMWQTGDSGSQAAGTYQGLLTWEEAFAYVAELNRNSFAAFTDWRMPNSKELAAIVDFGAYDPASFSVFSSIPVGAFFWSSTTYADVVSGLRGYGLDFREGLLQTVNLESSPEPTGYVKAVRTLPREETAAGFPRSGQTNPIHNPVGFDLGDDGAVQAGYPRWGQRFIANANGTVSDRATALIWQGEDSSKLEVAGLKDSLTWEDAFLYIERLNRNHYGGYSTWRLPNQQELLSLIDYGQFYPAIPPLLRSRVGTGAHWSGTSRFCIPSYKWYIDFTQGAGGFRESEGASAQTAYVIAVTGGPGLDPGPTQATPTATPYGYTTPPVVTPTPIPPPPTPVIVFNLYYGVPATGQTEAFHERDDGYYEIGYPLHPPRWEDLGTGVVADWATGLMWQQGESNSQPAGGRSGIMSWEDAFAYVASLNRDSFGGFSDWRIPNALELLSTRDLGLDASQDPNHYLFTGTTHDPYWTSTCSANFASGTAVYQMSYGFGQSFAELLDNDREAAVRACRSFFTGDDAEGFPATGQTLVIHPPGPFDLGDDGAAGAGYPRSGERFVREGTYTVRDRATGLTWLDASSPNIRSWTQAFDFVDGLNSLDVGGYNDWRLPNHDELVSLVDFGRFYPVIDPIFAGGTQKAWYWSSSTVKTLTSNAWAVDFSVGVADVKPKDTLHFVRAVRGYPRPGYRPTPPSLPAVAGDYTGDGTADAALYRPSAGAWMFRNGNRYYLGENGDRPVPQAYTGYGRWQSAVFRPTLGKWIVREGDGAYFGAAADEPVPADYDGDGRAAIAVFRPGQGKWMVRNSTRAFWGGDGDLPVSADYDGDGTVDIAVYRPAAGKWMVRGGVSAYFGGGEDIPVPGDYDGDGTREMAVFRPSTGKWLARTGRSWFFGSETDLPLASDFDGDGSDDAAVFRSGTGKWMVRGYSGWFFGSEGDIQVTAPY